MIGGSSMHGELYVEVGKGEETVGIIEPALVLSVA